MNNRIFLALALGWGLAPAKTLLLLPVVGDLEKSPDISTVNDLYKDALQASYGGTVKIAPRDTGLGCAEKECAVGLAKAGGADEVVYSTLRRLGSKWIFSSTIVASDGGNAFNQRGTAQNLEDLEAVTKRVSDAIVARKSVDQVASLDNITAKEENREPTRRKSLFNTGFSLGYLLPTGGTYAYLKSDNSDGGFSDDCPCTEKQPHSAMIRLGWLNSWEFRENMMLGAEASWAIPNVLTGDIDLTYLFSKTDISPFAGGGLGLQYVVPLDDSTDESKRNSGPALNVQGGLVFFRTYDIHLIARAQYQVVFNSDIDNGAIFDLGVVYRPKEKATTGGGGVWSSFWTYYLIGALVVGVIGAASN